MLKVLMIGYGAVAGYAAARLSGHPAVRIEWGLCRAGREAAAKAALGDDVRLITTVADLAGPVDVAIDCAGHAGLAAHGPDLLARGIDVATVSIGALADAALADRLADAARAGGAQLELVAGAIGAVDALAAARQGGLDRVTYTARKPPAGWRGTAAEEAIDLDHLEAPVEFFRGTAREAALRYPKNANVAATIGLAGLGLDETTASLIADPTSDGNRHEIAAAGAFGSFRFEIEGRPLPGNPKSSSLTAMAVVRAILNRATPIRI